MRNIRTTDKKNIAKMANKGLFPGVLTHDSFEYYTDGFARMAKAHDPVGSGS